jgi:hypothetical protein
VSIAQKGAIHIAQEMVDIGKRMAAVKSSTKSKAQQQALNLPPPVISECARIIARFGLREWNPSLRHNSEFLYNTIHRIIAITTFQMAFRMNSYDRTYLDARQRQLVQDFEYLTTLFNQFVFKHIRERIYRRNGRIPGSVIQDRITSNMLDRRRGVNTFVTILNFILLSLVFVGLQQAS